MHIDNLMDLVIRIIYFEGKNIKILISYSNVIHLQHTTVRFV